LKRDFKNYYYIIRGGKIMTKKLIVNLILISLFIIIASSAATFEFKMDFNDEEVDYDARNIIDLTDFWQVTLAGSGPVAKVVEDGDNKYLYLEGYSEIYTIDMIEPPYTFSLDVQVIDTEFVAFFVRAHFPISQLVSLQILLRLFILHDIYSIQGI
jgi:hypothetical protein